MNWQLPHTVTGKILSQSDRDRRTRAAPTEFSAELFFDGGVSVGILLLVSSPAKQQWVHVSGEKGWLRLPDFVHPLNSYEPAFEVNEKVRHRAGRGEMSAGR